MKMYPIQFEIYDDANDEIAVFTAFDEESLGIELKQSIWTVEELHKLADAYELATEELKEGVEI